MRRILSLATLAAGTCLLVAGTAQVQSARSCFRQAQAFSQAVTAMGSLSQDIGNPSTLKEATDLRNRGMEACLARPRRAAR